jgi:periplasmic mercuric ion binding protein
VHFPRDSGATEGKVSSLTVTGIHNCCGACNKAVKTAVKKVPGVTGDTAKQKSDTFEVTGDFEPSELIRALHEAGFHVKVKK